MLLSYIWIYIYLHIYKLTHNFINIYLNDINAFPKVKCSWKYIYRTYTNTQVLSWKSKWQVSGLGTQFPFYRSPFPSSSRHYSSLKESTQLKSLLTLQTCINNTQHHPSQFPVILHAGYKVAYKTITFPIQRNSKSHVFLVAKTCKLLFSPSLMFQFWTTLKSESLKTCISKRFKTLRYLHWNINAHKKPLWIKEYIKQEQNKEK